MILPSPVQVTKASNLEAQRAGSRDSAMIRQGAVIGKSDKMCATASGKGVLVTNPHEDTDNLQRHELSAGDFAFVPPWTEHQEINETDEDVVWVLIRGGPHPVVVYLEDWGGSEAKAD
ncbi:putative cupin domain-containing protein [Eutypa lata UCREL1]|uniref:Putative cupin domain-containing protein n=1 Tax=Eutypa lata (strain UCR-EL1) TaxID=1287681 RepID=M7TNC0_EUTLA|nr:putative cupin domain-containing protein [Eutypa lata UCREL1]